MPHGSPAVMPILLTYQHICIFPYFSPLETRESFEGCTYQFATSVRVTAYNSTPLFIIVILVICIIIIPCIKFRNVSQILAQSGDFVIQRLLFSC